MEYRSPSPGLGIPTEKNSDLTIVRAGNWKEGKGLLFPSPIVCLALFFFRLSPLPWTQRGKSVVLNRECILGIFCLKQGQGFKHSEAHLYPNIGRVPPWGLLTLTCTQILVEYTSSPGTEASTDTRKSTYLGYVHTKYRKAFAPARKPYRIGILFTQKNGDLGAISVTEISISKVESQISDRCSHYTSLLHSRF